MAAKLLVVTALLSIHSCKSNPAASVKDVGLSPKDISKDTQVVWLNDGDKTVHLGVCQAGQKPMTRDCPGLKDQGGAIGLTDYEAKLKAAVMSRRPGGGAVTPADSAKIAWLEDKVSRLKTKLAGTTLSATERTSLDGQLKTFEADLASEKAKGTLTPDESTRVQTVMTHLKKNTDITLDQGEINFDLALAPFGASVNVQPMVANVSKLLSSGPLRARNYAVAGAVGNKFIVWGGSGNGNYNDGAIFDTTTGVWTMLPTSPLVGRYSAGAAVVGSKFIVWGGTTGSSSLYADGAILDTASMTWTMMPTSPLSPRKYHAMAAVGSKVIVFGGYDFKRLSDGAVFDVATASWTTLPQSPLGARYSSAVGSVGNKFLVWGGVDTSAKADGAIFDLATVSWTLMPTSPLSARYFATGAGAGTKFIVWGGYPGFADGAAFDTVPNTWSKLATSPRSARYAHVAAAVGKKVVIWGGTSGKADGAVYDSEKDIWLP